MAEKRTINSTPLDIIDFITLLLKFVAMVRLILWCVAFLRNEQVTQLYKNIIHLEILPRLYPKITSDDKILRNSSNCRGGVGASDGNNKYNSQYSFNMDSCFLPSSSSYFNNHELFCLHKYLNTLGYHQWSSSFCCLNLIGWSWQQEHFGSFTIDINSFI